MAAFAPLLHPWFQVRVGEVWSDPILTGAFVVTVAGNTILLHQLLMERELDCLGRDRLALGRSHSDVFGLVAISTLLAWRAEKRLMASEAVGR